MRKRRYPFIIVAVVLSLIILAANFFFDLKLSLNRNVASALNSITPNNGLERQVSLLEKEIANLKAQLFREIILPQESAIVYSSYPFNNKSEIIISWGTNDGVSVGDAVTYGTNILVGQVKEVTAENSVVTTIFDPGFETAVRIGAGATDGLMKGGNELTLSLIPQDMYLEVGDLVTTADKNFPYGLELGSVGKIENSEGDVFQEAILEPALKIKDLRDVTVYR